MPDGRRHGGAARVLRPGRAALRPALPLRLPGTPAPPPARAAPRTRLPFRQHSPVVAEERSARGWGRRTSRGGGWDVRCCRSSSRSSPTSRSTTFPTPSPPADSSPTPDAATGSAELPCPLLPSRCACQPAVTLSRYTSVARQVAPEAALSDGDSITHMVHRHEPSVLEPAVTIIQQVRPSQPPIPRPFPRAVTPGRYATERRGGGRLQVMLGPRARLGPVPPQHRAPDPRQAAWPLRPPQRQSAGPREHTNPHAR